MSILNLIKLIMAMFSYEDSNVIDLVEVDGVWQIPSKPIDTYV